MTRRTRHRLAVMPIALGLAGLAAFFDGCTIMNGLTVPEREGGAGEAGAADAGDGCDHAFAPNDQPSGADFGSIEAVTAVRDVDLGVDAGGGGGGAPSFFGFDLDNACTCPGPPTCTAKAGQTCDDQRGRDNALTRLVRGLSEKAIDVQASVTDDLEKGANGLLIIVEGYNGQRDDSRVDVVLASSPGLRSVLPDGGVSVKRQPTFTRSDAWLLDSDEFIATDAGVIISARARQPGYVRDNQLVVKIGRGDLRLGEDGLVIQIADGYLVGTMAGDETTGFYLASGEVGGRWSVKGALERAREVRPTQELGRLCEPIMAEFYATVKQEMCSAVDIMATVADDNAEKACDAISVSLRFVGAPAGKGPLYKVIRKDECPPSAPGETECPP